MTPDGTLAAAAALFDAFAWQRLMPLLMLLLIGFLLYWMLAKAQRMDPTFKAVDFLREAPGGKASFKRLTGMGCFIVHSWYICWVTVGEKATWNDVALYCVTWSGSMVLLQWLGLRAANSPQPAPPPHPPAG